MKICITSLGPDLDSPIDSRFGRAQFFLLLNDKGNLEETLPNPGISAMGGAGITAAQLIADKKTKVLITGNVGPNAFGVLSISKIQIFLAPPGISVKDAFLMWKDNKLTQIQAPSAPGHFGLGPRRRGFRGPGGFGRRGRRGRGRGGF